MKITVISEQISQDLIQTDRTDPRVFVDPQVQRNLRVGRAKTMAENFRPEGLGILTGSERDDLRIHLIDGQTRWTAAGIANYEGPIMIQVYKGLKIDQEASLFLVRNETAKPNGMDRFKVRCIDNDPTARAINSQLIQHGWKIDKNERQGGFASVVAAERVWSLDPQRGPRAFAETLEVIQAAWGNSLGSARGVLIEGLGRFLFHYGDNVDLAGLAKDLSHFPGGPNGLYGQAMSFGARISKPRAVGLTVREVYNHNRRQRRLASYDF